MNMLGPPLEEFAPRTYRFYRHALTILKDSDIPFLVGGAYAFANYTGIIRHTKDLDVFLRRQDIERALDTFAGAGYRTELVFAHWLGKVFHEGDFIDLIFNSGNGNCPTDDSWFRHAHEGAVLGERVLVMPAEEMIWQKAYIMERERFDGADVIHLLRARGPQLDWQRLLDRFGDHWRVLLSHIVLFGFVYPGDQQTIPPWVLRTLIARLLKETPEAADAQLCQGPLLSRLQYLPDTQAWCYTDARLAPRGGMTAEQIDRWTDAARDDGLELPH